MNLLISSSSNPYYNLANEEYLLKHRNDDFLFLYINQPCVVVGKHQIAQKEINSNFIDENKILVARRLSGGGTVYHDEGNLNFSFIRSIPSGENYSYKTIIEPIIGFLLNSGFAIEMSERNDIVLGGKKISGSAMHIYKNRLLAHGTLLINSNLENLSLSLKGHPERFSDKSIASRRSKVMNLSEVKKDLTARQFLNSLSDFLIKEIANSVINSTFLTEKEIVSTLVVDKYSSLDWIYGYSPKYTYQNKIILEEKNISYQLEVEKGIIEKVYIDLIGELNPIINFNMNTLQGMKHNIASMKLLLSQDSDTSFSQNLLMSLF